MAIALRGTATRTTVGSPTTAWNVTKPTGVVSGDVILIALIRDNNSTPTVTGPTGFTKLGQMAPNNNNLLEVWRKVADGTEGATLPFTLSATEFGEAVSLAYIGVDNTTPEDVTTSSNSVGSTGTTTPVQTSQTTVTNGAQVVGFWSQRGTAGVTGTAGGGATEQIDFDGVDFFGYVEDLLKTTAGAVALTATWNTSLDFTAMIQVALRPASAGSAPSGGTEAITGTVQVASQLTCTSSSWSGSPTSYTYVWKRADDAGFTVNVTTIQTTSSTSSLSDAYLLTSTELAKYVRCDVTATNAFGTSSSVPSNIVGPVAAAPTVPTGGSASLTGSAINGQTLTGSTSGWTGSPTSYTATWQRADDAGFTTNVATVRGPTTSGSTNDTYTVAAADIGKYIRVQFFATNGSGNSSTVNATPVGPVVGLFDYIDSLDTNNVTVRIAMTDLARWSGQGRADKIVGMSASYVATGTIPNLTVTTTPVFDGSGFSIPANTTHVLVTVEGNAVRFTENGGTTAPSSTNGLYLAAGSEIELPVPSVTTNLRFCATAAGSATLNLSCRSYR